MALTERIYEGVLRASRPLFRAAAVVHGEAGRAVRGRRDSLARFEAWGASGRDVARPLVWLHAPSVGEGLMAQGIMAALRERRPDVQLAFTHFSPSAERIAGSVGADVTGYLPWDTRDPVRRALAALRPSAIAFVRTEVWPVLTREARHDGARLYLVNAVLSERSGRLGWPGRSLLAPVYRRLDAVGAVSEEHAARYTRLGVAPGALVVTGDARFDQVTARVRERGLLEVRERLRAAGAGAPADVPRDDLLGDLAAILPLLREPGRFTMVAGSTWDSDEAVLVPALEAVRGEHPMRVVIAPHQPTEAHLEALGSRLEQAGIRHARLSGLRPGTGVPEAVLVDRLGVLADLYAIADLAYVGGGFRGAGLHSVVEPAGLGVPVVFGPRHGNAREAAALQAAGGGFVVETTDALAERIGALASEPGALQRAGEAAAAFVRAGTGAAGRNAELILGGL